MYGVGGAHILQLILTFFLMPESAYERAAHLSLDTAEDSDLDGSSKVTGANQTEEVEHTEKTTSPAVATGTESLEYTASTAIFPTMHELLPWSGYNHQVSFLSLSIRPIRLIISPIVFWCTILFTTCVAWLVLIAVTISQIFSGPPYYFGVEKVGATNISSFVASVIGALIAHRLSDGLAVWMAKRNHGFYGMPLHARFCVDLFFADCSHRARISTPACSILCTLLCCGFLRLGSISVCS
jgi:hypothetical protein